MPNRVPPLTQLQLRNAKAGSKLYKLADGGDLYLEVMPRGGKLWCMKYRQRDGVNYANRPVRTRTPGGVAGDRPDNLAAPMPIVGRADEHGACLD